MYRQVYRRSLARPLARGFTLVELLIVMAVLTLLAAVTLPTVKDLLADQKSSQGARLVQGYAEAARSRAIATGRPVAMIIERMKLDASAGVDATSNDTALRLSMGEVFPPYEGDWYGATAQIGLDGSVQYAEITVAQVASLWDLDSGRPSGMVQPDDSIQFGDSPKKYRISGNIQYDATAGTIKIPFENPSIDAKHGVATEEATRFPSVAATGFPSVPLRFRIFRKPSKSLVGSVTLPRGICIDLSVSGIGPTGREFGAEAISNNSMPAPAGYYGPVFIVFSPSGTMQHLHYATAPNSTVDDKVRHTVGDVVHLLVGKTEQVFPNPAGTASTLGYLSQTTIPSPANTVREDVTYNILDPTNFWISINPYSGAVTSTKVQALDNALPVTVSGGLANVRTAQARSLALLGSQRTDE